MLLDAEADPGSGNPAEGEKLRQLRLRPLLTAACQRGLHSSEMAWCRAGNASQPDVSYGAALALRAELQIAQG